MNKIQLTNLIVAIIGLISTSFGIYLLVNGASIKDFFFQIFLGVTLIGTAYINNQEWKDNK